jgi:hypothetical protein
MLPFQREIYKIELKNKLDRWKSPAGKDAFYGKLPTNAIIPDFGILRDGTGYFYMREDFVAYYSLTDGKIVRIKKNWSLLDWNCYNQLSNKAAELNTFRLDVPLYREEIVLSDGSVWEYAELQSPGNSYGINLFNDAFPDIETGPGVYVHDDMYEGNTIKPSFFPDSVREDTANFVKNYIDDAYEIARQAVLIASANNCGIPESLGNISNRYRDDVGSFWSDIDQSSWNLSKDHFLQNATIVLRHSLDFLHSFSHITSDQRNQMIAYAGEKWITI